MKKTIKYLVIICVLMIGFYRSIKSQNKNSVDIGLKLLFDYKIPGVSLVSSTKNPYKSLNEGSFGLGITAGGFLDYYITNKLIISPEISFHTIRSSNHQITDTNNYKFDANFQYVTLSNTAFLKYWISYRWLLLAGVRFDIPFYVDDFSTHKISKSDFSSYFISATFGINYVITQFLSLEIKYNHGFNDVFISNTGQGQNYNMQNRIMEAGLVFTMPNNSKSRNKIQYTLDPVKPNKAANTAVIIEKPNIKNDDADNDGLTDNIDKCPTVFGLTSNQGCPQKAVKLDSDKDGILDGIDICPNIAGPASNNGCPQEPIKLDSDKDGVLDSADKCPNIFGLASNKGCPVILIIKEETKNVLKEALTGIKFESNKSTLKISSYNVLNKVVKIMQDNPNYKLTINGYTDNIGNPQKNKSLSADRAAEVKKYLISEKINPNRLKANGYGAEKPIGDNKTKEGQENNRRVELNIVQ